MTKKFTNAEDLYVSCEFQPMSKKEPTSLSEFDISEGSFFMEAAEPDDAAAVNTCGNLIQDPHIGIQAERNTSNDRMTKRQSSPVDHDLPFKLTRTDNGYFDKSLIGLSGVNSSQLVIEASSSEHSLLHQQAIPQLESDYSNCQSTNSYDYSHFETLASGCFESTQTLHSTTMPLSSSRSTVQAILESNSSDPSSSQILGPILHMASSSTSQLDPYLDLGYESLSAAGSYQEHGSEKEQSGTKEGSQGQQLSVTDQSDKSQCDDNELENMIYHFGQFFRDQFETKLQQFQEEVFNVIDAQKSHVRGIVRSAIADQNTQKLQDALPLNENLEEKNNQYSIQDFVPPSLSTNAEYYETLENIKPGVPIGSLAEKAETSRDGEEIDTISEQQLLELMSLSCGVGTLLAKSQFRS